MNIMKKNQILDLLDTVHEGLSYIIGQNLDLAEQLLGDCSQALEVIAPQFDALTGAKADLQEKVYGISGKIQELPIDRNHPDVFYNHAGKLREEVAALRKEVDKNLVCKLEILFLPYKYSMWDCMESIWEEAKSDKSCNCHIVPIPYYDKNSDGSFGMEHYEGNAFPMEIEDFSSYCLKTERPDIIYFHNPYDGYNFVTSVAPDFYAPELAKHTNMLVYVPYAISGFTSDYKNLNVLSNSMGCQFAHKIILHSEELKKGFIANGVRSDKIAVLGTPKIDAVMKKTNVEIPDDWKEKIGDRKVILLNTGIATLLRKEGWLLIIKDIMSFLMNHPKVFLIWRPHPLQDATIGSMRPGEIESYNQILALMDQADNIIKDPSTDPYPAIGISDGLLSDYSSILLQYAFTGKPALSLDNRRSCRKEHVFCDFFSNYFLEDGDTVENFVDMIINNTDQRREERIRYAKNSVLNGDGTSGMKIHKYIKKTVLHHSQNNLQN